MFGLIFDVDGVLADTEGPVAEATIAMFEDLENPPFGHWGTIVVWYS